jgi:uncharacterized protein (TIGR03067 family)
MPTRSALPLLLIITAGLVMACGSGSPMPTPTKATEPELSRPSETAALVGPGADRPVASSADRPAELSAGERPTAEPPKQTASPARSATDPEAEDMAKLQGKWEASSCLYEGEECPRDYHQHWRFEGNQLIRGASDRHTIKLYASEKVKEIDIYKTGPSGKSIVLFRGLYKFDGPDLVVAFQPGDDRPKYFETTKKDYHFLMRFKKQ